MGELGKLPGKKFAVIVDEAHSSQTGESVKDLKLVLTSEEQLTAAMAKDDEGESEDPIEAELERIQKARQKLPHLSFFAFTATPKDKTLELFGTPDKKVKKGFSPFHEYTMRQWRIIHEGQRPLAESDALIATLQHRLSGGVVRWFCYDYAVVFVTNHSLKPGLVLGRVWSEVRAGFSDGISASGEYGPVGSRS
ncbi:MAG: hypothetical protein EXS31_15445 [Pedosphaera sp.]|nr:hypothetical protein [Pedosphaera sp.]